MWFVFLNKLLVMGIFAELCISLSLVLVNSFVIALVICLLCNQKNNLSMTKSGCKFSLRTGECKMNECMLDRQTAGCVVEKIVLPQIVSIKQASEIMKLPPYYLRRVCRENPDIAFQSGVKWYINLGKLAAYYNNKLGA